MMSSCEKKFFLSIVLLELKLEVFIKNKLEVYDRA